MVREGFPEETGKVAYEFDDRVHLVTGSRFSVILIFKPFSYEVLSDDPTEH